AAAHTVPDQAADHFGSILQLRHVINSHLAVRPQILPQLFVPSTAGFSARMAESDDEDCGMPRGCFRQHDLLASERVGFGMRNDLRRETRNHQQHEREPEILVQNNPLSDKRLTNDTNYFIWTFLFDPKNGCLSVNQPRSGARMPRAPLLAFFARGG